MMMVPIRRMGGNNCEFFKHTHASTFWIIPQNMGVCGVLHWLNVRFTKRFRYFLALFPSEKRSILNYIPSTKGIWSL